MDFITKHWQHDSPDENDVYIALENIPDVDFIWTDKEIQEFERFWKKNVRLKRIAKRMNKSELSVFFLAVDRILQGHISDRDGWQLW